MATAVEKQIDRQGHRVCPPEYAQPAHCIAPCALQIGAEFSPSIGAQRLRSFGEFGMFGQQLIADFGQRPLVGRTFEQHQQAHAIGRSVGVEFAC